MADHSCPCEFHRSHGKCTSPSVKKKGGKVKPKVTITKEMIERRIEQIEKEKVEEVAPPVSTNVDLSHVNFPENIPNDLKEKYLAQVTIVHRLHREYLTLVAKLESIAKDKDYQQSEFDKANDKKNKLESICRELQKQNKIIMDEVKARGEEEQGKRRDLSDQFSVTINEITAKMEEQAQERLRMAQENEQYRLEIEQLKELILAREDAFKKTLQQKENAVQKMQDKLKEADQNIHLEEQKFEEFRQEMESRSADDEDLRTQLNLYSGKFEQFQQALQKSNPVFQTYKISMDKMSRKIKDLDHKNEELRSIQQRADKIMAELLSDETQDKKRIAILEAQNQSLQQLCKNLNTERAALKSSKP